MKVDEKKQLESLTIQMETLSHPCFLPDAPANVSRLGRLPEQAINATVFSFQMDLMPFINKAGCECLNESDEHGFENCLRKDSTYLESDCDEQVFGLLEN